MSEQVTRSLDDVLAEIAVPGADPATVSDYAMDLIATRSRRRRVAGGAAAMLVVAATTAYAVTGGRESRTDEVVSPGDPVTTTEAPDASKRKPTPTSPRGTAPVTTIPTTTDPTATTPGGLGPVPTVVAQPPPTVTATTSPVVAPTIAPDQPGSGTLSVASGVAGQMLDVVFEFDDPDGPGGTPAVSIATDELGTPPLPQNMTGPSGGCDGGTGTSVRLRDQVQFASTGSRTVRVAVKYCNGPTRVFNTTVQVNDPTFGDGTGWAVMAEVPASAKPLEQSHWEFHGDDGRVLRVDPPAGSVLHDLGTRSGTKVFGVVIVLPAGTVGDPTAGSLVLTSRDSRYTGRVDPPVAPSGSATRVPMALSGIAG